MYNSIIIIILAIIAWQLWKINQKKSNKYNPTQITGQLKIKTEELIDKLRELREKTDWDVYDELIKETEKLGINFMQLVEKYRHNEENLKNILIDWDIYLAASNKIAFAWRHLDLDYSQDAHKNFDEATQDAKIQIEEIKKRTTKLFNDK